AHLGPRHRREYRHFEGCAKLVWLISARKEPQTSNDGAVPSITGIRWITRRNSLRFCSKLAIFGNRTAHRTKPATAARVLSGGGGAAGILASTSRLAFSTASIFCSNSRLVMRSSSYSVIHFCLRVANFSNSRFRLSTSGMGGRSTREKTFVR